MGVRRPTNEVCFFSNAAFLLPVLQALRQGKVGVAVCLTVTMLLSFGYHMREDSLSYVADVVGVVLCVATVHFSLIRTQRFGLHHAFSAVLSVLGVAAFEHAMGCGHTFHYNHIRCERYDAYHGLWHMCVAGAIWFASLDADD